MPTQGSCWLIPCDGSNLDARFRFEPAFNVIKESLQWQQWNQSHPGSQLEAMGLAHRPEASLVALGDVPANGTGYVFGFVAPDGARVGFGLRALDGIPISPVIVNSAEGLPSSFAALYTFDIQYIDTKIALASLLVPTIQADILQHNYSLLLIPIPGLLTPNKVLETRWVLVDLETNETSVASGYDGRLLGTYWSFAPPYL